jgi:hypothetical protein
MKKFLNNNVIIFVCDSRDYHAMDWFHTVKEINNNKNIILTTDFFDNSLTNLILKDDQVIKLLNINSFIFKKQNYLSDLWRNIIKLAATIMQVRKLKLISKQYPTAIFHAHSMYYIFLCWLANLNFIATPMGSDVLVRPDESLLYRFVTQKALKYAAMITVDSVSMQKKVSLLSNKDSIIIQNGIDVKLINSYVLNTIIRNEIVSIRGFYANYQIEKIIHSRTFSNINLPINFVYPFYDSIYRENIIKEFIEGDNDMGRLQKHELYSLLAKSVLVLSIPESDSSPRSVYEAIFAGACVAASYSEWIDTLPWCMKERVIVVDLNNPGWLLDAIKQAEIRSKTPYIPTYEALVEYDQYESMKKVCKEVYNIL